MRDVRSRSINLMRPKWATLGFDLVSLRQVMAAAEEQSFAAAAQRENTSLSAVSRRISELEARIGVQLFERRDRGVVPTNAGLNFVSQLYDLFDQFDRMALDLDAVRGGALGLVRLHAHMSATAGDLPTRLASFMLQNPGIEVVLTEDTSAAIVHAVSVGTSDLGLVSEIIPPTHLDSIPWRRDQLVVILPPGHALGDNGALEISDLVEEPFVCMQRESSLHVLCRERMELLGRRMIERVHATSFESVRRMVSAGLGLAIVPLDAIGSSADVEPFLIRELNEDWAKRQLLLCARDVEHRSAATKLLISYLIDDLENRTLASQREAPRRGDPRHSLEFELNRFPFVKGLRAKSSTPMP